MSATGLNVTICRTKSRTLSTAGAPLAVHDCFMRNAPRRFRAAVMAALGVSLALLLVGCTPAVEAEEGPIRATATLFQNWDGRCGFGLQVENIGVEPVHFLQGDFESVEGVSTLEWDTPFKGKSTPDGYDLTINLPPTIEPGDSARIAFVANCDGEPLEIVVKPIGLEPLRLTPFD
jgi:hypothetical protein